MFPCKNLKTRALVTELEVAIVMFVTSSWSRFSWEWVEAGLRLGLAKNWNPKIVHFRLQTEILPLSTDQEDFAVDFDLTLPSSKLINGIVITFADDSSCQNDQLGKMNLQSLESQVRLYFFAQTFPKDHLYLKSPLKFSLWH